MEQTLSEEEQKILFTTLEEQGVFEPENLADSAPEAPGLGGGIFDFVRRHKTAALVFTYLTSLFAQTTAAFGATHIPDDHTHHDISGDDHHLTLDGHAVNQPMITLGGEDNVLSIDHSAISALMHSSAPLIITDSGGIDTFHLSHDAIAGQHAKINAINNGTVSLNINGANIVVSGMENIQVGDHLFSVEGFQQMGLDKANHVLDYLSKYPNLADDGRSPQEIQAHHDTNIRPQIMKGQITGEAAEKATELYEEAIARQLDFSPATAEAEKIVQQAPVEPPHQHTAQEQSPAAAQDHSHSTNTTAPHASEAFEVPHNVVEQIADGARVQVNNDGNLVVGGKVYNTHGAAKFIVEGREVTTFDTGGDPAMEEKARMMLQMNIERVAKTLHNAHVQAENAPPPEQHGPGVHHSHQNTYESSSQVSKDGTYLTLSSELKEHITAGHKATVEGRVLKIDGMEIPLGEALKFLNGCFIDNLMPGASPKADAYNQKVINESIIGHRDAHGR